MAEELKACPFCGGKAELVQFTRKRWSVECFADGCGSSIISCADKQAAIDSWNTRAKTSQGGEAVAMRQRFSQIEDEIMAGKHTAASVFTQMRTAALYTHPADQVADAERWRYYAPKVARLCGVTMEEFNAEIDAELMAKP